MQEVIVSLTGTRQTTVVVTESDTRKIKYIAHVYLDHPANNLRLSTCTSTVLPVSSMRGTRSVAREYRLHRQHHTRRSQRGMYRRIDEEYVLRRSGSVPSVSLKHNQSQQTSSPSDISTIPCMPSIALCGQSAPFFVPGCVITLDALGNCVVDQVFQVSFHFETEGHPHESSTHAMTDYKLKLIDPHTSHRSED